MPTRYSRTVVSDYARTITLALVGLVATPILVRHLGAERYGIWVLVGSIALYLELLEFGFGTGVVKYAAEFSGRGDVDGVRRTAATSFWVLALPGLAAFVIGGLLALVFPTLFHLGHGLGRPAQILLVIVIADLAISIPSDTFGGTLIGLQRFDVVNVSMMVVTIAQALGWWLVLAGGGGLVALGAVTVAISLAGQLSRFLIARRYVPELTLSPRKFDRSLVRSLASLSAWFAVIDLAKIVVARIDVIVVGLVVGVPAAGVYAVGQKLALASEQVITPVTKAFLPHSSELAAREEDDRLRASILAGTRISLAIAGPVCIPIALLARPLLDGWVGAGFGRAEFVVVFLLASTAITSFSRTGFLMLQGVGDPRRPATILAGEAVVNLGLSIWLGRAIGVTGVALATLIAASISNFGFMLPAICRRFGVSVRGLARTVVAQHLPAAAAAFAVGYAVRRAGPANLPETLGACAAIAGSYLLAFAFSGLERRERRLIVESARRRLRLRAQEA